MAQSRAVDLAERIDAVLPQTQCRQCGYAACRPYAEAITAGVSIDRCAPGGSATIAALAGLTGRDVVPLAQDLAPADGLERAVIDESRCIGCTLCIKACPVDAITGGPKRMHAVLSAACTGCALCLPPCPVDCITMVPAGRLWSGADAETARAAYRARNARAPAHVEAAIVQCMPDAAEPTRDLTATERRDAARQALERARARRLAMPGRP